MLETWYFGLAVMIVCSIAIAKASDVFEAATDYLGRHLNDGVKGVTLNAIGSSFPELLTTVFFLVLATKETLSRDLAASIGGNTGSAIFNSIVIPMLVILVVLGIGAKKFNVSNKVILRDGIFLILAELLLLVILSSTHITHWHGWILTGFYLVYLSFTLFTMKKSVKEVEEHIQQEHERWYEAYIFKNKSGKTFRSWNILGLAVIVLSLACAGLVEGCIAIADSVQINPLFIALVLVAAASSVPDTIISMKDARKGNHNDALSNVLGSNIFDVTISMGLPLAIFLLFTGQSISFETEGSTLIDIRVMLLIITIITIAIYYFSKTVNHVQVVVFGFLYLLFILYVVGAAQYHNGNEGFLANISGMFIEYLNKPGGLEESLRSIANKIGVGR